MKKLKAFGAGVLIAVIYIVGACTISQADVGDHLVITSSSKYYVGHGTHGCAYSGYWADANDVAFAPFAMRIGRAGARGFTVDPRDYSIQYSIGCS